MKWNKYTIETTTAAEDYLSSMLMELGIEGIEIEDKLALSEEDKKKMPNPMDEEQFQENFDKIFNE